MDAYLDAVRYGLALYEQRLHAVETWQGTGKTPSLLACV